MIYYLPLKKEKKSISCKATCNEAQVRTKFYVMSTEHSELICAVSLKTSKPLLPTFQSNVMSLPVKKKTKTKKNPKFIMKLAIR